MPHTTFSSIFTVYFYGRNMETPLQQVLKWKYIRLTPGVCQHEEKKKRTKIANSTQIMNIINLPTARVYNNMLHCMESIGRNQTLHSICMREPKQIDKRQIQFVRFAYYRLLRRISIAHTPHSSRHTHLRNSPLHHTIRSDPIRYVYGNLLKLAFHLVKSAICRINDHFA